MQKLENCTHALWVASPCTGSHSSLPAPLALALTGEELPLLEPRQVDMQHPGNSCCLETSLRSVVTWVSPSFISIFSSYSLSLAEWPMPPPYGRWSSIRKWCFSPMLVVIPALKELSGISWCEKHFCEKLSLFSSAHDPSPSWHHPPEIQSPSLLSLHRI